MRISRRRANPSICKYARFAVVRAPTGEARED
jgi:hypothetical protein